ncbi:CRISPR-associated protein Cas8c/Csd1, subtype I-C/DVULG [Sphaerochaeta pleomorpha str. Grapes]|uniref:CRISPR-associated protein Cas8c/Csd1, subtype I-C/DVULG n=1 Tax=Sphaerochaeta pleomorpha (strain ATCC BAA-1885 / DSM 22778 / Grapes) TaxID=158190 RepID=G8QQN5_SPHPG|nr:type I-C CRISPR-associated protein Cas8c/Csd1 [Sphaerochaeta pleomorpha]AEV30965.1 CRISPR-associated protein Cas8c/Csd1, subtype I-C/DVULG [Sphaerochaeta pleomorpha str. Grapes]
MILQALSEYYYRLDGNGKDLIAPLGWEKKEIPFIFVLDEQGSLLNVEDTREGEGNKKLAKTFLVPQGVKKTSGVAANLLWDTVGYVTGYLDTKKMSETQAKKKIERLPKEHQAFIERIETELIDSPKKSALIHFLHSISLDDLRSFPCWEEIAVVNPNVSFRFSQDLQLYCQNNEVKKALAKIEPKKNDATQQVCLVSGEKDSICTLHTAIKGVYGAQSSGANIVSFNLSPFNSYGKKQGENAPISEKAMFTYTTALNTLLGKNSKQRMQIGDASTVFWAGRMNQFEKDFLKFFAEPSKDDPNANTQSIRSLMDSPKTGEYYADSCEDPFYVLGLSPNAARISIRFWFNGIVSDFSKRIRVYFEDLAIVKPPNEPEYYSIWRLLVNIAVQGKSENIPPNISSDFMRSILMGTPYPQSLLQMTLRRIKNDGENRVPPVRAALLKAILNRNLRLYPKQNQKELDMSLDIDQPSIGYQLGRLFSTLTKIQEEANPGINASIADRYYGSACSTPVSVFGTLMRLMRHHLAKIENPGRRIQLERQINEIVSHIDEFPAHLNLNEQGRFAVGYYHQRQAFFTKKETELSDK